MSKYRTTIWSVPLENTVSEKFDKYIQEFEKDHKCKIGRAKFARFVLEFWETHYLSALTDIESLSSEIEKKHTELKNLHPLVNDDEEKSAS